MFDSWNIETDAFKYVIVGGGGMKHSVMITLILVCVFFVSQIVGLVITDQYIAGKVINETTGEVINITYTDLPLDIERPEVEESNSWMYIVLAVLIGTILVLLLVRFKGVRLWKAWFFLSVALCLTIAFYAFLPVSIAAVLAVIIAILKIYKPNFLIHNLSEVFIYGGLAAIFVPIMNVLAASIMLILISIYDMIAVWKSKHMVKMAKFQSESKVFAGLSIPYKLPTKAEKKADREARAVKRKGGHVVEKEVKSAILGGGDIGFPLLFAGVIMKQVGFLNVLVVPIVAAIALFLLLYYAKKDRFYPAMPFLSAGCFVGYGIMLLII
jgi:presenilin-like A22 family membrane protease